MVIDRHPQIVYLLNTLGRAASRGSAPVPNEVLERALWPDELILPEAASNRMWQAISRLRKSGLKDQLVRATGGYRLATPPEVTLLPA